MTSKILDYERPARKARAYGANEQAAAPPAIQPAIQPAEHVEVQKAPPPYVESTPKGPMDYPAITNWLKMCEDDFERGRDKHAYMVLAPMFEANGCTRIDDITRMSPDLIKLLSAQAGFDVTLGLVHRVFQYAAQDVIRVRKAGKLVM